MRNDKLLCAGNNVSALAPVLLVFLGDGRVTKDCGLREALDESSKWIVNVPWS
jgi:hypothetical protein